MSNFNLFNTRTNNIAHGIQIVSFGNTPGLILTVNDRGWMEVSYLGTETSKITSVTGERKEIDYEKAGQDYVKAIRKSIMCILRQLTPKFNNILEQIDKAESQGRNVEASESLNIHAQAFGTSKYQGYLDNASHYFKSEDGLVLFSKVRISLTYKGIQAQNLSIFFNLPINITTLDNPILIDSIKGDSTPFQFDVDLFALKNFCPYKNDFEILVNFQNVGSGSKNTKG